MARLSASRSVLVALAAAFVVAVLAMVGCSCSSTPASSSSASSSSATMVTVPNVVSLTRADADKALASVGLAIGETKGEASDTVPAGSVISQDPKGLTTAATGSKVNLVISTGKAAPKDVQVPDLKGKSQTDAEKALADLKLVGVASNPEESTEVAPGQVFKQSVAAGTTVKEGTSIAFTVALAPGEVTVPDVVGKTQDEAKAAITGAKLGFDHTTAYSDTVAEGKVISQSVSAGSKVRTGSTVTVAVSLGAKPASDVKVPDVMTYSWSDAEHALQSAGLTARYTGDPAGVVISQDVAAGTMVAPGTLVTVTLGNNDPMVEVPNLVGMSVTSAEEATDNLGLGLDIKSGGNHGTVKAQWPEAGTQVKKKTVIAIEVDDSDFRDSGSSAVPQAQAEPSPQAAAPDFAGSWSANRASIDITNKGNAYHVLISWGSSANESTKWEYDCTLDNGTLVAKGKGKKTNITLGDGGKEQSEVVYSDGSATFSIDGSGKLTWKDQKEDAGKGLSFTRG